MNQKGFIPLFIILIALIITASAGTGVVLQKQGKLAPFIANVSNVFTENKNTEIIEEEKPESIKEGAELAGKEKKLLQKSKEDNRAEIKQLESRPEPEAKKSGQQMEVITDEEKTEKNEPESKPEAPRVSEEPKKNINPCEYIHCDNLDKWVNLGSPFTCQDENNKTCTCQTQIYHDYSCSNLSQNCIYSTNDTKIYKYNCVSPTPTPTPTSVHTPTPTPTPTPTDTASPTISNVNVINIGIDSATITWSTDEISTSQIEYGATEGLGSFSSLNSELLTSHSIILSGLNLETKYYYKIISKDGANNPTVSSIQTFSTISSGNLNVSVNSGTSHLIAKDNLEGITFTEIELKATKEDIKVNKVIIARVGGTDNNFSKVSLWDGSIKIAENTLSNGSTILNFEVTIPKNISKVLTIKANVNAIGSGSTSGDNPKLCIVANGITALGISSGVILPNSIDSNLCGNDMILVKSTLSFTPASLPSTYLIDGNRSIYRWGIKAQGGAIGWKKMVFNISGGGLVDIPDIGRVNFSIGLCDSASNANDGIYISIFPNNNYENCMNIKLIDINSLKFVDFYSPETQGNIAINHFSDRAEIVLTLDNERVVESTPWGGWDGTIFELQGDFLPDIAPGSQIITKISTKSTNFIGDIYGSVAITYPPLIWTDRSADNHSELTTDWFNDYGIKLPGALVLSNG